MIRQSVGDLLEVHFDDCFCYVVVLTKIYMFGGNVVFAFHGDGSRRVRSELLPTAPGFNICTDLLLPKREGIVKRLDRIDNLEPYWRTALVKATHEHRLGVKAKEWFIYNIGEPHKEVARVKQLSFVQAQAMDNGCYSFDLVAQKCRAGYLPEHNQHL